LLIYTGGSVGDRGDKTERTGSIFNLIEVDESSRRDGDSASSVKEFYSQRHLRPANLSPLRKQLEKQLVDLKEINGQGAPKPPMVHRPSGAYLSSNPIIRGKD